MKLHAKEKGFTLLELMATVVILMVVMSGAISLITYQQKISQTQQLKGEMYQSLRGTAELMAQEIGQAGLVSLPAPLPTLSGNVSASTMAQPVAVSSATSMFIGEKLLIDTGTSEELVTLTLVNESTNQVTAIFSNSHTNGAIIRVLGNYPNGIMATSTGTQLQLFGDINSDGSLVYVRYDCNTTAGTLSRSITTVTPTTTLANPDAVLLTNLVANPNGTACFQYTTQTATVNGTTYTFVTNVAITLSVETTTRDLQTGQFLTMTKSLLNVAPRNVLMGLEAATASTPVPTVLEPTPPNLPLT